MNHLSVQNMTIERGPSKPVNFPIVSNWLKIFFIIEKLFFFSEGPKRGYLQKKS